MLLIGCISFSFGCAAAKDNPDDGAKEILKELAKSYKDDRTVEQIKQDNAFIRAAGEGDVKAIRRALKDGARINSRYLDAYAFLDAGKSGYTALMFAVSNRRTEAIKALIENKADLEVK